VQVCAGDLSKSRIEAIPCPFLILNEVVGAQHNAQINAKSARHQLSYARGAWESPNAIHPDRMSTTERIAEIAEILARGFIRLRPRQSTRKSADDGDSPLDCPAIQSGYGHESPRRGMP
jgi:hypothetical protein